MPKETITTDAAPAAVGPYSQAVRAGDCLYLSGQIPIDPETGQVVTGDITEQTRRVLENLKAVIEAAELTLVDVVKVTVYLDDMGNFTAMNEVYASYFAEDPPARACVQAAALPKGVAVEMDAIAFAGGELPPAVGQYLA